MKERESVNREHLLKPTKQSFQSVPWCFNGHAHTILCSRLFSSPALPVNHVRIPTPDDDFLEVEWMEPSGARNTDASAVRPATEGRHSPTDSHATEGRHSPTDSHATEGRRSLTDSHAPTVILLHGLEGNARRYYIRRLAEMLLLDGFSIAALHFRSCSGTMNRARRFYHSGETDDLKTLIQWILNRKSAHQTEHKLFLAGFSLGASVILNYLAKEGGSNVTAFAAVSAPFDLKAGSIAMNRGFSRIYQIRFLKSLKKKLAEKRKMYPDLPYFQGQSLYEFDDQVTAPLHGFTGAEDYYEQCSSGNFMEQISTPGLFLHSREDPICPFETVPAQIIQESHHFDHTFPDRGGHVGFWSMPAGWAEVRISSYFKRFAQ